MKNDLDLDVDDISELDDAACGRAAKEVARMIRATWGSNLPLYAQGAGIIMVNMAREMNATDMKLDLDGMTSNGSSIGDWEIAIRKKK